MAKRQAEPNASTSGPISAELKRRIEAIKRPFASFVADFASITVSRAELAPKVMKIFGQWQAETGKGFVDFARVLDPTIPADRTGYRSHKSYQAADYLRRLNNRRDTGTGRASRPVRNNAAIMARLISTILPLVSNPDALWRALADEGGLKPRQVTALQERVKSESPMLKIRGAHPAVATVVHVEPESVAA